MQRTYRRAAAAALLCGLTLTACSTHTSTAIPAGAPDARGSGFPVSPAFVEPAPMVKTRTLPAAAMRTVRPDADFQGTGWYQIPGAATQAAAAPDGTLWVLSTDPGTSKDKYIWHYAGGQWTNVPGLATQLAPAPDGSLYAINSGGGTYHYVNGQWTALGGGAQAVSIANDGSAYVVSNDGSGAIWQNSGGNWTLVGGSGTIVAANVDPAKHDVNGSAIGPYGLFVLNAAGGIYFTTGTSPYVQFPGAASSIATTQGGFFVLAYPTNPTGNTIYYYDYGKASWKAEPGAGTSISANSQAVYVVSANAAIYATPLLQPLTVYPASSLSLTGTGSANMQTVSIGGGTAPYTLDGYDASVISVVPETANPENFDITPLKPGQTSIAVRDSAEETTTISVTVTTVSVIVQ